MKSMKRITAIALAMVLLLSFGSFAQAADPDHEKLVVTAEGNSYSSAVGGSILVELQIKNNDTVDYKFFVSSVSLKDNGSFSASIGKVFPYDDASAKTVVAGGTASIQIPLSVTDGSATSITGFILNLNVKEISGTYQPYTEITDYISINVTKVDSGSGDGTTTSAFRLSPVDANGNKVSAPSGNYGDKVTIRIPIMAKAGASNITIAPVLTTSLDTFPFVISNVDYTLSYPGSVNAGQVLEFQYTFTLSKKVTAGVKMIDFIVNADGMWPPNGTGYSDKISIFLTVNKGASVTDGTGTPPAVSTPKLIVESYTFSTDKVYAGETFDVTFVLRNTSETENIQNLQIRIADDTNTILPAASGSNTLYIAKIGKGETYTETISLQTTPGAEAKAYTLGVEMDYEAASTKTAYKASESISVPVLQKIRVKADEPVIYDEAWMGSPFSMYLAFYNLGKSTVYNCTVTVEGDGLAMEVGYFGGNVSSGAAMNADFTVIPSVAGDISANVVISYEDVYGEQYELKMPFNIYVNDMGGGEIIDGGMEPLPFPDDGGMVDGGMNGGMQPGLPVWVWIVIGVAVLAGGAVLVILLKRRRNKELEEL